MSQTIAFPASLKEHLQRTGAQRRYPLVEEVLRRGGPDELIVQTRQEAQALVDVARLEMTDAGLKYPFWDEDTPRHDRRHADGFQDVQMGVFEKTVMYVGQAFPVVTTV